MKAISLWQPWALFVALGWKTIETRTHDRFKGLVGQRIGIHTARKLDKSLVWLDYLPQNIGVFQEMELELCGAYCGLVLCTATVKTAKWAPNVDFVEYKEWNRKAMCDVAGKFCLFLEDIQPYRCREAIRGRQGIFNVPDNLIKEII